MKVHVQFYSYLRDTMGRGEDELTLQPSDTAGRALEILCQRYPKLADCRRNILLGVGLDWVKPDAPLKEGDVLSLMPPVQGGGTEG